MRAFDFSRTDGQALLARLSVVELIAAFAQTPVGFGDGAFNASRRFQATGQVPEDQSCFVLQEVTLLLLKPWQDVLERRRRGGQVFTDMVEVHQIGGLWPELQLHLGNDPGSAVADGVSACVDVQSGALSDFAPEQAGNFSAGQGCSEERRG